MNALRHRKRPSHKHGSGKRFFALWNNLFSGRLQSVSPHPVAIDQLKLTPMKSIILSLCILGTAALSSCQSTPGGDDCCKKGGDCCKTAPKKQCCAKAGTPDCCSLKKKQ